MTFSYPLPCDTKQKFTGINECKCTNLSLWLDRYVRYNFERQFWEFQEEQKAELYQEIAREFKFHTGLIEANYQRWRAIVETFVVCKSFTAFPEWRMVVGLGQTSILETSMTLDRITGIPIIPGSALKGLAASYAMLCDLEETHREKAEESRLFKLIFGTQGETGKVIFLDAIPTNTPQLEPDIMNNHYPDYYGDKSGKKAPTPYQNPVPVYFLTLGKKSEFAFAVVGRDQKIETKELVEKAYNWLKGGLSNLGIGAKTAAGYGYLEIKE